MPDNLSMLYQTPIPCKSSDKIYWNIYEEPDIPIGNIQY